MRKIHRARKTLAKITQGEKNTLHVYKCKIRINLYRALEFRIIFFLITRVDLKVISQILLFLWPEKKNSKKISLHLYIGMFITYKHDVLWINPLQEDNFSQKIDLSPATSKVRHMKLSPYIYNKPRKCHIPAIQCTLMIVQILVHSKMLLIIKITFHARHSNHLAAGVGLGHNEGGGGGEGGKILLRNVHMYREKSSQKSIRQKSCYPYRSILSSGIG